MQPCEGASHTGPSTALIALSCYSKGAVGPVSSQRLCRGRCLGVFMHGAASPTGPRQLRPQFAAAVALQRALQRAPTQPPQPAAIVHQRLLPWLRHAPIARAESLVAAAGIGGYICGSLPKQSVRVVPHSHAVGDSSGAAHGAAAPAGAQPAGGPQGSPRRGWPRRAGKGAGGAAGAQQRRCPHCKAQLRARSKWWTGLDAAWLCTCCAAAAAVVHTSGSTYRPQSCRLLPAVTLHTCCCTAGTG